MPPKRAYAPKIEVTSKGKGRGRGKGKGEASPSSIAAPARPKRTYVRRKKDDESGCDDDEEYTDAPKAPRKRKDPDEKPKRKKYKRAEIPPFNEGSMFAIIVPSGYTKPAPGDPGWRLIRLTEKGPPSEDVLWYEILYDEPLPVKSTGQGSTLWVAYKEMPEPLDALKNQFRMPIRWETAGDPEPTTDGQGGTHWMWYQPHCTVRWSDRTKSAVSAVYFCVVNVNFAEDFGTPIWEPNIDMGYFMREMFGDRYVCLPNCHPEPGPAIAGSRCSSDVPQRSPAWHAIRKGARGGTIMNSIFDMFQDAGEDKQTRSNVAMRLGITNEDTAMARVLWSCPNLYFQQVGWVQHPTDRLTRGTSPDGLLVDTLINRDNVPPEIISGAIKAGYRVDQIDWSLGVAEIKCSSVSSVFSAYYIPQIYNHMICTGRWWARLFKFNLKDGTVSMYHVWRDVRQEAIIEQVCRDPRVLAAKKGYVKEVVEDPEVEKLRDKWDEMAKSLTWNANRVVKLDGIETRKVDDILKEERRKWFVKITRPPGDMWAHQHSEHRCDPNLEAIWSGANVEEQLDGLQLVKTHAAKFAPRPRKVWTGAAADLDVLEAVAKTMDTIAVELHAKARILRSIAGG